MRSFDCRLSDACPPLRMTRGKIRYAKRKILKINFYAQARFPCASASQFAAQAGSPEVNSRDYIIVGSKWSREEEHGSSTHGKFSARPAPNFREPL